ncbi:MAG: hypothetical protein LDLANPLL_00969 [Turneriella sp.]|nr:hypothetical protein [Turneriella sp.]
MKWIVVSNRLPFELIEKRGRVAIRQTTGGVATGIQSYIASRRAESKFFTYRWVGWPGNIREDFFPSLKESFGDEYIPVLPSKEQMANFYDGFCNQTLWPLLHSFPMLTEYNDQFWQNYCDVNILYCNKIAEIAEPEDIVFINDYHLMLLPRMLREILPNIKIAFFLHTPFPHFSIFRLLPTAWSREILESLVSADVVGFHTNEYREYFLHSVRRVLGFEHNLGIVTTQGHVSKAGVFPMGIDFGSFSNQEYKKNIKKINPSIRKILSIDRLDYTKGILSRLNGYAYFLEKYPEMRERVQLNVVAVPSRIGVDKYQDLKSLLDALVGEINGRFSKNDWLPIFYRYTSLTTKEVIQLYRECDIALVTPLRDGMNLIAKEYLASRQDNTGVLILSEMAGAAGELPGAIIVNPNSASEIGEAIKTALELTQQEQIERNRPMREYIKNQDIREWVRDIMESLDEKFLVEKNIRRTHLANESIAYFLEEFYQAENRLCIFDYDGTLVPFTTEPEDAVIAAKTKKRIERLAHESKNSIFIVSGRNRYFLEKQFTNTNIGLVAEHGAFMRRHGSQTWEALFTSDVQWMEGVCQIMERFRRRIYGSSVERKELSIVFHYRNAFGEAELIKDRVLELYDVLLRMTGSNNLEILRGSFILEVRRFGMHKGTAVARLLNEISPSFAFAIGDDLTDEDMFRALPKPFYSIKVGHAESIAPYYLNNVEEVEWFIEELENSKRKRTSGII